MLGVNGMERGDFITYVKFIRVYYIHTDPDSSLPSAADSQPYTIDVADKSSYKIRVPNEWSAFSSCRKGNKNVLS